MKKRDSFEDLDVDGGYKKRILQKSGEWVWSGFIWLRTGISDRLF